MHKLSEIVRDEEMSPLNRAVYWTEYVIRHNGASVLRSPAAEIPMYQYLLLDILGVIIIFLVLAFYVTRKVFWCGISIIDKVTRRKGEIKKIQ